MPALTSATQSTLSQFSEQELRKKIDQSLSRAMFDSEYARHLLADPTIVLDDRGCTPQQFLELRSIRATSIVEFARQAESLFWPSPVRGYARADAVALAAAAI
jgi:hypothetical protein